VLSFSHAYLSASPLAVLAQPIPDRLAESLHEACSLGILDGDEIVYLGRSTSSRIMSPMLNVGRRFPAYCTSIGQVLIARLPAAELLGLPRVWVPDASIALFRDVKDARTKNPRVARYAPHVARRMIAKIQSDAACFGEELEPTTNELLATYADDADEHHRRNANNRLIVSARDRCCANPTQAHLLRSRERGAHVARSAIGESVAQKYATALISRFFRETDRRPRPERIFNKRKKY
jgi:hypothetical protein